MKITLRIPTADPYAFVEVELEPMEDLTADQLRKAYDEMINAFKVKSGLTEKEFNDFLDNQLSDKPNHIESLEKLNDTQSYVIQCLKRAMARKAYKTK